MNKDLEKEVVGIIAGGHNIGMDDNERALHEKSKLELMKLILKKNDEITGHLRDKLQLTGENTALKRQVKSLEQAKLAAASMMAGGVGRLRSAITEEGKP